MFRQPWMESTPVNLAADQIINLKQVSVTFGKIKALQSIDLSVRRGEILFVTGPSGAGKTSLMRILAGDLKSTGRVDLPSSLFVAEVFQDFRLFPGRTCEENLLTAYDPLLYNTKNEFAQDMGDLCKALSIDDRMDLKIIDANGGLRQKVAILRALLAKPDILLADEPTSSLDHENARRVFDILNLYNAKRGLTVVWASHNRGLVKSFTGRVVHLDKGKLINTGKSCFT
ncbi:MAG: ATP-binding cassette domain-containing protein [Halobacteriovoraceae bacterium]|nr:ATP-binding cassette domain-containing protein [Halobacteriovoraceae bacterium]